MCGGDVDDVVMWMMGMSCIIMNKIEKEKDMVGNRYYNH